MQFAIPGLQAPSIPKKESVKRTTDSFGTINFAVSEPWSNSRANPKFKVYISKADSIYNFQNVFTDRLGKYVFRTPLSGNFVEYRFILNYKEALLDRGNYRVTVFTNDIKKEYWLSVTNSEQFGVVDWEEVDFAAASCNLILNNNIYLDSRFNSLVKLSIFNPIGSFVKERNTWFYSHREANNLFVNNVVSVMGRERIVYTTNNLLSILCDSQITREVKLNAEAYLNLLELQNAILVSEPPLNSSNRLSITNYNSTITVIRTKKLSSLLTKVGVESKQSFLYRIIPAGSIIDVSLDSLSSIISEEKVRGELKKMRYPALTSFTKASFTGKNAALAVIPILRKQLESHGTVNYKTNIELFTANAELTLVTKLIFTKQLTSDTSVSIEQEDAILDSLIPSYLSSTVEASISSITATLSKEISTASSIITTVTSSAKITRERSVSSEVPAAFTPLPADIHVAKTFLMVSDATEVEVTSSADMIKETHTSAAITTTTEITTTTPLELIANVPLLVSNYPSDITYNPYRNDYAITCPLDNDIWGIDADTATVISDYDLEYAINYPVTSWRIFGLDPIRATIPGHSIQTGDTVHISGVSAATHNERVNNLSFVVTRIDANTIEIQGTTSIDYLTLFGGNIAHINDFTNSVAFSLNTRRYLVTNRDTNNITVVDEDFVRLRTINLGAAPSKVLWLPGLDRWVVFCAGSDNMYLIDDNTYAIINTGGTTLGNNPTIIDYAATVQRLCAISTLDDKVYIINASTGALLNEILISDQPKSVTYIEETNEFFVSCEYNNNIYRINASSTAVASIINVTNTPRDVAFSPVSSVLAVVGTGSSELQFVDLSTNTVLSTINIGYIPTEIIYIPYNNIFVTRNEQGGTLSVIDAGTRTFIKDVPVGNYPIVMHYNNATRKLLVLNQYGRTVNLLDIRFFKP